MSSGTSSDGVDLALIRSIGAGLGRNVQLLAGVEVAMPASLQDDVRQVSSVADVALLHGSLGRWFGKVGREFLEQHGVAPSEVAAAGSHGQTVHHHDGNPEDGSLQLGDAAILADALNIPVVSDFRWTDLAAGGQGAPISPYADAVLHGNPAEPLAILNLGGLANLTLLLPHQPPQATDTGPANGPLDALMRLRHGEGMDLGGQRTAAGEPDLDWVKIALEDSFFSRPLPKSTGLERFGLAWAENLQRDFPKTTTENLLATAAQFAARAVFQALEMMQAPSCKVFVAGGGVHNRGLMEALRVEFGPKYSLQPYSELGWDPDLREAVAFALLADAFLLREVSVWPETTACRKAQVLGRWTPKPAS